MGESRVLSRLMMRLKYSYRDNGCGTLLNESQNGLLEVFMVEAEVVGTGMVIYLFTLIITADTQRRIVDAACRAIMASGTNTKPNPTDEYIKVTNCMNCWKFAHHDCYFYCLTLVGKEELESLTTRFHELDPVSTQNVPKIDRQHFRDLLNEKFGLTESLIMDRGSFCDCVSIIQHDNDDI